ncbi:hypothetical protein RFI_25777, partial [Reticulomyxa filosa]
MYMHCICWGLMVQKVVCLPAVPLNESFIEYLNEVLLDCNAKHNNLTHVCDKEHDYARNDPQDGCTDRTTENGYLDIPDNSSIKLAMKDESSGRSSNTKGRYLTDTLSSQLTNPTQESLDMRSAHLNYVQSRSCEKNSEEAYNQQSTVTAMEKQRNISYDNNEAATADACAMDEQLDLSLNTPTVSRVNPQNYCHYYYNNNDNNDGYYRNNGNDDE